MATARVLVQRALDDLSRTLKPEDARFFRETALGDLWKEMRAIEHEQGQRLDMRFMRRLEPFLETMESYSKGPIKLMLLLARQYTDVMDKLLQAYSDIANVLPRIDKLKSAFGDDADFKQVLGLIYSDILDFHQRAYRMFRRKGWHLLFAIHWGFFERRFKSIIQSLAMHCDLLDKEAAATHFLEMKDMREKRKLEEDSFEEQTKNQFAREALRWLSAEEDSQEEFLHRLSDQRLIGTCDWILDEPEVMGWMEDNESNPTVWVTGKPGSGKSHSSSLIVQHSETKKDRSTLYFFCGSRPFDPKDASTLLIRTVTVQLLRQNLDLAPLIHQDFLQKGLGPSGPTIRKVLKEILSTVTNVRIILDGIDEWGQTAQQDTLKILAELQRQGGNQCKLLVSSRKEPLIAKHLPQKLHVHITGQTAAGLHCYIQSSVESLREQFADLPPSIFGKLQRNLVDKANGMFLWVRLVMNMMEACSSEIEFDEAIEQLPDGLDEAYGRILSRLTALDPRSRERALNILYWTCISYRLMSIDEVTDGIALKPGQRELCARNRSRNPDRDILELCAPLLEKSERGILDMVHFSAKEYLLNLQSGPFVDMSEAHFHIAFSCVANLTSARVLVPSLGKLAETDIERAVVTGSYGLHLYAHQYWADHVTTYLGRLHESDAQNLKVLIEAMEHLSIVLKGHSSDNAEPWRSLPPQDILGIDKLYTAPGPYQLLSVWIAFRSNLGKMAPTFDALDVQDKWMLSHDSTYFSLIDKRLREVTERLLKFDRSALPSHIHINEYDAFVARFHLGFACRTYGCTQSFASAQERDHHELLHTTSFVCLRCDFSPKGFKSRQALKIHTEKYHMSPDDFKVPQSLELCLAGLALAGESSQGSLSRSWTEQGQRAIQQSFHQVLTAVESKLSLAARERNQRQSCEIDGLVKATFQSSTTDENTDAVVPSFEFIREAIEDQRYDSLCHFKDDLQNHLLGVGSAETLELRRKVDIICDDEVGKVADGFPGFATVDRGKLSRNTYWSLPEEKELPALLHRYGRDLVKIATCLRTKTLEEIELHLLSCEEAPEAGSTSNSTTLEESSSPDLMLDHANGPGTSLPPLNATSKPTEERNPSYVDPEPSGIDHGPSLHGRSRPTQGRPPKRRRLEPIASLRNLPESSNDTNRLPSIRLTPNVDHEDTSDSPTSSHDWDSIDEDPEHSTQIALLPDISFDHLLPPLSADATSEQAGPLIRPDQVPRLPHLNEYEKTLCLDQLEALYSILSPDQNPRNQSARNRANEEHHLLTKTLLTGWRDWRERSVKAPTLSFSI
ncbi:hypothetical protein Q9189_003001 [Teloschistes chrysophthalmus]